MLCHEGRFLKLDISLSPNGIQKEEIVVTNAYPTSVEYADELLTSCHSMDNHSQVDRVQHFFVL